MNYGTYRGGGGYSMGAYGGYPGASMGSYYGQGPEDGSAYGRYPPMMGSSSGGYGAGSAYGQPVSSKSSPDGQEYQRTSRKIVEINIRCVFV